MASERRITIVSHGPNCLDGLTCAVVAARYFAGRRFEPLFVSNRDIDQVLLDFSPAAPEQEELWITDISWRDEATDRHLNSLIGRGMEVYWVDHHRSAIELRAQGRLEVNFTDYVLDEKWAASRLLFEYLCRRTAGLGESKPGLLALHNLVMMADDVDRWVLKIDRSRELALAIRAMDHEDAYRSLLSMDSTITYNVDIKNALMRLEGELARTFSLAHATRRTEETAGRGVTVVAAECNDYAGEIADRWSLEFHSAVFALYDHRSGAVSLRRTPDCTVDLSRLASEFGGGGHSAAAGCELKTTNHNRSSQIALALVDALAREVDLR